MEPPTAPPLSLTHTPYVFASLEEDKGDGGCLGLPEGKAKGESLKTGLKLQNC